MCPHCLIGNMKWFLFLLRHHGVDHSFSLEVYLFAMAWLRFSTVMLKTGKACMLVHRLQTKFCKPEWNTLLADRE